ncbi:MAG: response regulator transcription factor [Acidobacteriota bacterium]|jgi:DNA-binding response OmpR family regulator
MPKILLCEDNPDIREMVEFILEGAGYDIVSIDKGHEVRSFVLREGPDLLLLDLRIPDLDGYGVLSELSRLPREAVPPVVILSAKTSDLDREQALAMGAREFLEKPFTMDGLLMAVQRNVTAKDTSDSGS